MKNIILLLLFVITMFILNVVFYYNSNDYREFLRWLKWVEEKVVIKEKEEIKEEEKKSYNTWKIEEENMTKEKEEEKEELNNKVKNEKKEIKLWERYKDILKLFNKYDLEPLKINTNLFDITNEYPDEYFEYYSRDLTLYFFPTKTYDDILDIFDVLSLELPFKINKTNSFWEKSFYINLNSNIDDSIVRLVIKSDNILVWLKFKRSEFSKIKKILQKFKK